MAYYMVKEELYPDESDWSFGEEKSVDNYHEGREDHWFGDQYDSEYEENHHGEELEAEPPDRHQGYTHKCQTKPWCNETESKFSYEDESDCDVDFYHYKNPPRRDLKPYNHGVLAHRAQGYTTDTRCPKPQIGVSHSFYNCGPKLPYFSGTDDYLQWEYDMEEYFWRYKTLEKEKLSCALNGLHGQALKWWRKEADERWHYKEPRIRTWGELKWLMNEEYVTRQLPPRSYSKKTPQPLVKHTPFSTSMRKTKPAIQGKCSTSKISLELTCYKCKMQGHNAKFCSTWKNSIKKDQVLSRMPQTVEQPPIDYSKESTRDFMKNLNDDIDKLKHLILEYTKGKAAQKNEEAPTNESQPFLVQGKSSKPSNLEGMVCYRCHKRGHDAVKSPTREEVKISTLELKVDSLKSSSSLDNFELKSSTSSIMHLPLHKDIETGIGATKEAGNVDNTFIIKEEPLDSHQQVLVQGENMENNACKEIAQMNHEDTSKKVLVTSRVQGGSQLKEPTAKPWKIVLNSLLIKEEPPDKKTNPSRHKQYLGGMLLNPLYQTEPNLPSLCAGKLVLRTKPFEEGGNDRILDHGPLTVVQGLDSVVEFLAKYTKDKGETNFLGKHVEDKGETNFLDMFRLPKLNNSSISQAPEPDTRSSLQQRSPEDIEDMRLLIKELQTLQNERRHKDNLYGLLTQSANSSKWNQPKRSSELKAMDFTSWTFCAKALFATKPNIELQSPAQKWSLIRTTWRLLLGLSRFQQAQERTNPPSDTPDTRPTKRRSDPVLFKECPGFSCFKGLQHYVWRPGDSLNHSESSREVSPCSSTHRIRRILHFEDFPYLADLHYFSNSYKINGSNHLSVWTLNSDRFPSSFKFMTVVD